MVFINEAPAADSPAPAPRPPLVHDLPPKRIMTAEELLAAAEVEETDVYLDGWGWVHLRQMVQSEFEQMVKDTRIKLPDNTWGADEIAQGKAMVRLCLVAPALSRAQVELLWTKAQDKVQRLLTEIAMLNRVGPYVNLKTGERTMGVEPEPTATFPDQRDGAV